MSNTEVASTEESNTEVAKDIPLITVSKMKEHEDGGATFDIETSPEATRMLVEVGLTALIEKVIDAENKEYSYHTEPLSQELIDSLDTGLHK